MQDFKETQEYTKSQHNATINTLILFMPRQKLYAHIIYLCSTIKQAM